MKEIASHPVNHEDVVVKEAECRHEDQTESSDDESIARRFGLSSSAPQTSSVPSPTGRPNMIPQSAGGSPSGGWWPVSPAPTLSPTPTPTPTEGGSAWHAVLGTHHTSHLTPREIRARISFRLRFRSWFLTIGEQHWQPDEFAYPNEIVQYVKGQLEVGEQNGYRHWQLVAYFKKPVRLSTVRHAFGGHAHCEPTRSAAADEYVWKEETAVADTRFEFGNRVWHDAKAPTFATTPATTEGVVPQWYAELGNRRRVTITYWGNALYVDCREYYDASGVMGLVAGGIMKPSKKGLRMSVSQWEVLSRAMEIISMALDEEDEHFVVEMGNNKRCMIISYQKRLLVDLREWWYVGKEGQLSPGTKGIALTPDQWFALVQHAPSVHARIGMGSG